ncbi:TPA: sugar translocase, partial [Clostridium perfringens]|nr:sugar translocase [Clostridium perfringens]
MNKNGRIKNSIRNALVGVVGQIIIVFINFISRSIFIKFLSTEYLGINGLFSNILTILSLAELGVGTAIVSSMYRPIANSDYKKISALMNLYSNVYKIIGLIIAFTGILLTPFIHIIIKDVGNISNIKIIYLIFLANTVISYFYAYKRSIISADQREYINSICRYICTIIRTTLQIIILYTTKNFILYLIVQVMCTVLENLFISIKADKMYPFLKEYKKEILDKNEKNKIIKNIKALMIYKVSSVMLDGTDNIIISAFVGVKSVGLLSNYNLIMSSLNMMVSQVTIAFTASIGNVTSKENNDKQIEVFNILMFITFVLYGISSIFLLLFLNQFISIWIGEQYVLDKSTIIVLVLNYFIYGMQNIIWTYRSAMGLFVYGRFRPIISAIVNVVVSTILAKYIGMIGVLLGTTITRVTTNIWYDPIIIFKYGFKRTVKQYYKEYIKYFVSLIIMIITSSYFLSFISIESTFISLIKRIIICLIITFITFFIIFSR